MIEKEAKECVLKNSNKKKNFQPNADELLPMWIYVIINSDILNILSECTFLQDFKLKDLSLMSADEYSFVNFLNAMDQIKKETNFGKVQKGSYVIQPIVISCRSGYVDNSYASAESFSSRTISISSFSSKKL